MISFLDISGLWSEQALYIVHCKCRGKCNFWCFIHLTRSLKNNGASEFPNVNLGKKENNWIKLSTPPPGVVVAFEERRTGMLFHYSILKHFEESSTDSVIWFCSFEFEKSFLHFHHRKYHIPNFCPFGTFPDRVPQYRFRCCKSCKFYLPCWYHQ